MSENVVVKDELAVCSISKTYRKQSTKANDNISIGFRAGEITALIGHNGAGKTTLLNQIIGITKPDSGVIGKKQDNVANDSKVVLSSNNEKPDIVYGDVSLVDNPKEARRLVSFMPQFHAPLRGVTLTEAIDAIMRIRGVETKKIKPKIQELVDYFDLQPWANRTGDKLSGGLQRLTSFLMTIAAPSKIILLDEPTNDVDPFRRKLLWNYLQTLAKRGHIIVIVTHNLLEVEKFASRYILLDKGKVLRDSSQIQDENATRTNELQSLLTATVSNLDDLRILEENLPPQEKYQVKQEQMEMELLLSEPQVIAAVEWVFAELKQGRIIDYKLSSATLDDIYASMVE